MTSSAHYIIEYKETENTGPTPSTNHFFRAGTGQNKPIVEVFKSL